MNMRIITANVDNLCNNQCHRFVTLGVLTESLSRPEKVITHTKMGPTLGQVHISSNRRWSGKVSHWFQGRLSAWKWDLAMWVFWYLFFLVWGNSLLFLICWVYHKWILNFGDTFSASILIIARSLSLSLTHTHTHTNMYTHTPQLTSFILVVWWFCVD